MCPSLNLSLCSLHSSPLSYPLTLTDIFNYWNPIFLFYILESVGGRKSNFRQIFDAFIPTLLLQDQDIKVRRAIINGWSLRYYGTSNRRKRVASVSNTKAMREMKNSRKSALEVGEFQWARIEMFSSPFSPPSNIRHDNFPRYRLVVSVIMTHIFHALRVAKIYDLFVPTRLLGW